MAAPGARAPGWSAPDDADVCRPNAARIYDYILGGSHNFPADRAAGEAIRRAMPDVAAMAVLNRAFLRRAVRFLVGQGVRQFLDLGSGIPTTGNVHEVAQRDEPACRVVYVDVEPVAVGHARSILAGNDRCAVVHADLREPDRVLADPAVTGLLDFGRPVAVLALTVLHLVADADDPWQAVAGYRDHTVPGSFLAVSHASADGQPPERVAALREVARVYQRSSTPFRYRDQARIERFFDGYRLVEPGLTRLPLWHPEEGQPLPGGADGFPALVGVGRRV